MTLIDPLIIVSLLAVGIDKHLVFIVGTEAGNRQIDPALNGTNLILGQISVALPQFQNQSALEGSGTVGLQSLCSAHGGNPAGVLIIRLTDPLNSGHLVAAYRRLGTGEKQIRHGEHPAHTVGFRRNAVACQREGGIGSCAVQSDLALQGQINGSAAACVVQRHGNDVVSFLEHILGFLTQGKALIAIDPVCLAENLCSVDVDVNRIIIENIQ